MEGISSEEECEDLVACQLFDGEIIFVTEGECNAQQVTYSLMSFSKKKKKKRKKKKKKKKRMGMF